MTRPVHPDTVHCEGGTLLQTNQLVAIVAAACTLGLVGCSGEGGGSPPEDCPAATSTVSVHVEEFKFREECVAVPSGRKITVTFINDHWEGHNFTVLEPGETRLGVNHRFIVIAAPGVSATATWEAFEAGTYDFVCTIHPDTMKGVFVVE